jgi:hypothetical protein
VGAGSHCLQVRRTVDYYLSAVVIAAVFSFVLYCLLAITQREADAGIGVKGGETDGEVRPAPGDHAEQSL